ncbi:hypothetical protein DXG01_007843 [Tephrocybe rancida]|nr:hypothetical protein DXG01_007843 [Tephrocybe rancida]
MASPVQKLSHSFITTLFYIWTVIQAFLSLRSPFPFPFKETSAVVPCAVEIDLERGPASVRRERRRGAYRMPAPPVPAHPMLATCQDVVHDSEHGCHQNEHEPSPGFPPFASPSNSRREVNSEFTDIDLSASPVAALPLPPDSPDTVRRMPSERNVTADFHAGDRTLDPFLEVKPIASPFAANPGEDFQVEDTCLLLFTLPLCTSTPPRKGHRRAGLTTITNLENINIPEYAAEVVDLSPSPTESDSLVNTPSMQRQQGFSRRRSLDFGAFDSPPPAWSTPTKPPPSIVVLSSTPPTSSQEPVFKPITPLRIVKRRPPKDRASTISEVSTAMISAIRDAFVETREELEADMTIDPRDLLNRASVMTCDVVPLASKSGTSLIREAEETEDDNMHEADAQAPATPPPPYALSNPHATRGLKAEVIKAFLDMKRYSVPACGSAELQYLGTPGTPASSVDSCLDDILASFEHLMTTVPELQASVTKSQAPGTAIAKQEKEKKSFFADSKADSSAAFSAVADQWSDVLQLESY